MAFALCWLPDYVIHYMLQNKSLTTGVLTSPPVTTTSVPHSTEKTSTVSLNWLTKTAAELTVSGFLTLNKE